MQSRNFRLTKANSFPTDREAIKRWSHEEEERRTTSLVLQLSPPIVYQLVTSWPTASKEIDSHENQNRFRLHDPRVVSHIHHDEKLRSSTDAAIFRSLRSRRIHAAQSQR